MDASLKHENNTDVFVNTMTPSMIITAVTSLLSFTFNNEYGKGTTEQLRKYFPTKQTFRLSLHVLTLGKG